MCRKHVIISNLRRWSFEFTLKKLASCYCSLTAHNRITFSRFAIQLRWFSVYLRKYHDITWKSCVHFSMCTNMCIQSFDSLKQFELAYSQTQNRWATNKFMEIISCMMEQKIENCNIFGNSPIIELCILIAVSDRDFDDE